MSTHPPRGTPPSGQPFSPPVPQPNDSDVALFLAGLRIALLLLNSAMGIDRHTMTALTASSRFWPYRMLAVGRQGLYFSQKATLKAT